MRNSPDPVTRVAILILILAVLAVRIWSHTTPTRTLPAPPPVSAGGASSPGPEMGAPGGELRRAVNEHAANVELETSGAVTRLLPDDNDGSRHERFLIRAAGDLSILVVYNLDLAPRVPVHVGDSVTLRGEYIWNDRGGMIHWTHHDPSRHHEPGWIDVGGRRYN